MLKSMQPLSDPSTLELPRLSPARPPSVFGERRARRGFNRRGFTLVELMVAVAVGVFVVSAIYTVFTAQTKQLLYQDLQMEMHQNLRLAMDVVSRTSRMAGYGTSGQTWGPLGFQGGSGGNNLPLPAIISYDGTGPNGSDALTIVSMDPGLSMNTNFTSPESCAATTLSFDPDIFSQQAKLNQLQPGEMIMCMDYAVIGGYVSYLWEISSVSAASGIVNVRNNSGAFTDFNTNCGSNIPMVMACSRAMVTTFYIDANESDGVGAGSAANPVLMMDLDFESPDDDDVPLVDNIEDMQVEYCLRSAIGGTDCTVATAWVNTLDDYSDGDNGNDADDVYMIRTSFVVRSSRLDLQRLRGSARPALANNTGGTTDNYLREWLSTEVTVRNMRLLNLP